jgi:hypothetical protein
VAGGGVGGQPLDDVRQDGVLDRFSEQLLGADRYLSPSIEPTISCQAAGFRPAPDAYLSQST